MSQYKLLVAIFAIFLFASFVSTHEHENEETQCNHDNEIFDPDFMDVGELNSNNDRRLQSGYPAIRLATNFDLLTTCSASFRNYVISELLPPIVTYWENTLAVKNPATTPIKVSASTSKVCEYSPVAALREGVVADHFVFFASAEEANNYLATSMFCTLSTDLSRPIISRVKLNINYLKVPNGDHILHEKNTYTLLHEMTHSFGFSMSLFPYFIGANLQRLTGHVKEINLFGSTRTVLDVPCLTTRLRNYFGCSSLAGAYMEQNGDPVLTANSHFERKFFMMDMMTARYVDGYRITDASLGVLEASGWYEVNYNFAEPNYFGAGQGCGFYNTKCSNTVSQFDEFCTGSARGCFSDGRSGGKCTSDAFSDNCKFHVPNSFYDCTNANAGIYTRLADIQVFGEGVGSKCFEGTLSTIVGDEQNSFCFRPTCVGSGSGTELLVQVGNKEVTCTRKGPISVPGYQGTLSCPDPVQFCQTIGKPYCPRNCMGNGTCRDGICVCDKEWTGPGCNVRV